MRNELKLFKFQNNLSSISQNIGFIVHKILCQLQKLMKHVSIQNENVNVTVKFLFSRNIFQSRSALDRTSKGTMFIHSNCNIIIVPQISSNQDFGGKTKKKGRPLTWQNRPLTTNECPLIAGGRPLIIPSRPIKKIARSRVRSRKFKAVKCA
jgi:hypothetical protein